MIPFVTIELDKPYRLRFGMGAMVEFEQLSGKKLMEIGEDVSFTTIAQLLYVMLKQDNHNLTMQEVCELVDGYADNLAEVVEKVMKAIEVAYTVKGQQEVEKK